MARTAEAASVAPCADRKPHIGQRVKPAGSRGEALDALLGLANSPHRYISSPTGPPSPKAMASRPPHDGAKPWIQAPAASKAVRVAAQAATAQATGVTEPASTPAASPGTSPVRSGVQAKAEPVPVAPRAAPARVGLLSSLPNYKPPATVAASGKPPLGTGVVGGAMATDNPAASPRPVAGPGIGAAAQQPTTSAPVAAAPMQPAQPCSATAPVMPVAPGATEAAPGMTYAARTALIASATRGAQLHQAPTEVRPRAERERARPPYVALLGMRGESASGPAEPPSPTGKCTAVSREQLLADVVRSDFLVDTLLRGPDAQLDAHERLLQAMPVRKGKWTPQEEAYTARMIRDFRLGMLGVADGTTLRCYLAKALRCDPMRITKKFAGREAIGKQVYRRRRPPPNEQAEFPDKFVTVKIQRDKLRHAFLVRVRSQYVASREPRSKDRRWSGCGPRSRKASPKAPSTAQPPVHLAPVGHADAGNAGASGKGGRGHAGPRSAAARRRLEAQQLQAKARQHPGVLRLPRGGVDGASTSPTSGGSPGHSGRVTHYASEHPGYPTRPAAGGSSGSSNDSQDSGTGASADAGGARSLPSGGLYAAPNATSPPFGPSSLTHAVPAMGVSAAGCSPRSGVVAGAGAPGASRLDVDGQWRTGGAGYQTPRKRASPSSSSQGRPPSAGPFVASPGIIGGKKRRRLSPTRRSPAGILGRRSPGSSRAPVDRLIIRDEHTEQHHEGAVLLTQFFQSVNSPVP